MRAIASLSFAAVIALGFCAPACKSAMDARAAIDPVKEAGPRPIKNESPHIELKADRTMVLPGKPVYVNAYGRGDLKGGWRCTGRLWCDDEGGCPPLEGVEPGAQCGEVGETWIWPGGQGRKFTFAAPGEHEICVSVHDRHGWLIGKRECVRVAVTRTE